MDETNQDSLEWFRVPSALFLFLVAAKISIKNRSARRCGVRLAVCSSSRANVGQFFPDSFNPALRRELAEDVKVLDE
jgi:hypothetical protein